MKRQKCLSALPTLMSNGAKFKFECRFLTKLHPDTRIIYRHAAQSYDLTFQYYYKRNII